MQAQMQREMRAVKPRQKRVKPLGPDVPQLTMSREESELKQLAYERERALWRKQHPARQTGITAEEIDPEG